jgi:hypothetical protein
MAKYTPSLSNDAAYQAYLDDQERRRKEAEKGQIRYAEAAKASRIQYTLPGYQGKSQNQGKTYQWERDLMQNEKIKGAGNSYTKKFDALTSRMGMTPGQAEEFRKYMDFKEDSQHVDPKMNKDGTIKQNQSLKYARDARLKTDVIDGILNNMHKTGVKSIQNEREKKEKPQKKEENGFLNGLTKAMEIIDRPGDAVRTGIKEKLEGRGLWQGAKDGFTGEKNTSGTELNKLIGIDPEKNKKQREISKTITSNLLNTSGIGMALQAFAPDEVKDEVAKQMPGATTETILDPLNLLGGLTTKGVREGLSLPKLAKGLSEDVANNYAKALGGGRTPEQVELALRESVTPHNVLADPAPKEIPSPVKNPTQPQLTDEENILQQLLGNDYKPPVKPNTLDSFTPNTIPKVEMPKVIDEVAPAERDFIDQELAPFRESADAQAQARQSWETVVKGAQEHAKRIKDYYGKIVPDGNSKDMINEIPPQFRDAKSGKGNDIYSFAEEEGFSSADEAIAFLKQIDADSKTRLKDLMPDDNYVLSSDEWDGLEQVARQKYAEQHGTNDTSMSGVDDILKMLGQEKPGTRTMLNAPTPGIRQTPDEILKNVNNSQAPEQVLESLVRPKGESEVVNPASASGEIAAGAETSSNMKPLGIAAGQPKANDISWVEEPQKFIDKVKSGKENAGTVGRKLKTEIISDLQPVKDVERSIAGMDEDGALRTILGSDTNVSAEDSLFKGLRGVRRSVSEAMKAAKEDYGSILKTLRANKISKRDFDEYASAVHFNDVLKNNHDLAVREGEVSARLEEIEQLAQGTNDKAVLKQLADEEKALLKEKSDLEPYKLPASATVKNVERILKRWENTPAMQQAQKAFMDAQNKDLELLVQSGVYSEATANAMKTSHPNYIYMGRAKDEASGLGAGGNSSKPNKFIIKRSKGSEENLKYSPLESAIRNRLLTYSNARRNSAMQQIEKLASVKGANQYFNELNPHSASTSQMRNSVKFFVDGAEKRYEVPPALKDAFENIDAKNAKDLVDSSLRAVANITRKGATYFNTDFIFSSVFRDANGLITSRTNMHPGELILGYMDSFMGKGLERMSGGKFKSYKGLYEKMGGHQTGFVTLDPQSTKQFMKDIDKGTLGKGIKIIDPRKWPEVITKFGGAIEHGPKLGEFRSAKNKGLGDADAMHESTEVIDYTDQGSTIRNWNDKIPFLNPAIRGNTRYFQAAKENFPAWMGKNLLYVTTPTVGIYMMRFSPTTSEGQRSKLRNMSEYQKNMFPSQRCTQPLNYSVIQLNAHWI